MYIICNPNHHEQGQEYSKWCFQLECGPLLSDCQASDLSLAHFSPANAVLLAASV